MQHGRDLLGVRGRDADERVKRADPGGGEPGDDLGEHTQRRPRVVRLKQQGYEHQRCRRRGALEDRHFQNQAADPFRCAHRGKQAHVGAERDAAEHRLVDPELVQQAQHLLRVEIHAVGAGVARLVAVAVTQQVEQHDAIAPGGQPLGQASAEASVEQQAVQPYDHPVAGPVDLVGQPVLTKGQGAPGSRCAGLQVLDDMPTWADVHHDSSASLLERW